VVGALRVAGSVHPQRPGKDNDEQEEEDACNFKPHNAADTAEGAQKAADPARNSSCSLSSGLTSSPGLGGDFGGGLLAGGAVDGSIGACGDALACHAPGHSESGAQHASYGLRFHSVMMVAATLAEPVFKRLKPIRSCSGTVTDVR
jgi:hypothetical protein